MGSSLYILIIPIKISYLFVMSFKKIEKKIGISTYFRILKIRVILLKYLNAIYFYSNHIKIIYLSSLTREISGKSPLLIHHIIHISCVAQNICKSLCALTSIFS